ncbi:MAG: MBOAT family O-acyltransferase [Hyphomicrobiaceae bacterium]|nr:MBOAT family O-acyltransferase [Hyphomicrobiaceae bacterium]
MVFHSFEFIFGFLPVVYAGFLLAHRLAGWTGAFRFLVAASLVFYAQWSVSLALVLVISVSANYLASRLILRLADRPKLAWQALLAAVGLNVTALVYFKYSNFLIDIMNAVSGAEAAHIKLVLPVGISFYTFVQIGYLVEAFNGQVKRHGFEHYALFAAFFPCVTAGPLVLQREMLEQMGERKDAAFDPERLAVGLTMFAMGLFKKVFLADSIAPFANDVFDGAAAGQGLTMSLAWIGSIAYALQLYFDFSGYSDMALGLGLIFGLKLPLNFDSPFKATSISDFWRRWHMTMTRFFTTYIYTPLAMRGMRSAGSRKAGALERYVLTCAVPAVVTFVIAGVWHGAGWTFVVYGLLHGVAIAVNIGWREAHLPAPPAIIGWFLTMSVVVSGLVIFRAPNLELAGAILAGMWMPFLMDAPAAASVIVIDQRLAVSTIILLGSIVLLMPNSQQILHRYWVSSDLMPASVRAAAGLLTWRPSFPLSVGLGITLSIAVASIGSATTFVYYQF